MHRLFHEDKISPSTVQKKKKKRGEGGERGMWQVDRRQLEGWRERRLAGG